jgi:hypothetical protein
MVSRFLDAEEIARFALDAAEGAVRQGMVDVSETDDERLQSALIGHSYRDPTRHSGARPMTTPNHF